MAVELLTAGFLVQSQLWFQGTRNCSETTKSHMQTIRLNSMIQRLLFLTFLSVIPMLLFSQNKLNPELKIQSITSISTTTSNQKITKSYYDRNGLLKRQESIDTSYYKMYDSDTTIHSRISYFNYLPNDSIKRIEHLNIENNRLKERSTEDYYYGKGSLLDSVVSVHEKYNGIEISSYAIKFLFLRPNNYTMIKLEIVDNLLLDSTVYYYSDNQLDSTHYFHFRYHYKSPDNIAYTDTILFRIEIMDLKFYSDSAIFQMKEITSVNDIRIARANASIDQIHYALATRRIYLNNDKEVIKIADLHESDQSIKFVVSEFNKGLPTNEKTIIDGLLYKNTDYIYTTYD